MKAIKQCTIKCNQAKNKKTNKKNIQKITKKLIYTQKSHIHYENTQLKKNWGKYIVCF